MVKKIIHIADIHIPNSEDERPYSDMLENFLTELFDEVKDYRDELRIVIAGDIFNQKIKTSNEAKTIFHKLLNFLNAIGKTVIFAGNHDMLEKNVSKRDSITPTFEIRDVYKNITFLDKELDYKSGILIDDNIIWVLYSIFDKFTQPDIDGLKERYPDHKIIGLYHGNIPGAVTDVGIQIDKGIDVNVFKGCDCVMAGHIHKTQEIKCGGVPVVYAGSLFQQNCGENITGHGFIVWDVENMTYKHHTVSNDYKIYKFTLSSYEDIKNNEERLINY